MDPSPTSPLRSGIGTWSPMPPPPGPTPWDQDLHHPVHPNLACRAIQSSSQVRKCGSRGAVPPLPHYQKFRPVGNPAGHMTQSGGPDLACRLGVVNSWVKPCNTSLGQSFWSFGRIRPGRVTLLPLKSALILHTNRKIMHIMKWTANNTPHFYNTFSLRRFKLLYTQWIDTIT